GLRRDHPCRRRRGGPRPGDLARIPGGARARADPRWSAGMSSGSRKKRATRPWQNPEALRDITDLLAATRVDEELSLPGYEVQSVEPGRAVKDYVCPACGDIVASGEGHVVV